MLKVSKMAPNTAKESLPLMLNIKLLKTEKHKKEKEHNQ